MFVKSLIVTSTAIIVPAAPGLAADQSAITAEVRIADPRGGTHIGNNEYRIEYKDSVLHSVNYALEVDADQNVHAGQLGAEVSARVGPALPIVFKSVVPTLYTEVGSSLKTGHNFEFWGVGAGAGTNLYGPVSISVGYRHRESFTHHQMNEERLNGGLAVALDNRYSLGAQYYRTRGTRNSDAVGLSVTRKF